MKMRISEWPARPTRRPAPDSAPTSGDGIPSGLETELLDVLPLRTQHGLAVATQPVVEEGRVDGAEVGVESQVAVVEVRQAGVLADDAPLHRRPGHEQARAGAVVGAAAA